MNKCDPFYCEGLTSGHIFVVSHFGWGAGMGQGVWGEGLKWVV